MKVIKEETRGEDLPRVAASSYLNTAPLIWSFLKGSNQHKVELLTHEAPARCAAMLARGEVDCALVPVIEYQRIPEIAVVRGVCVGSRARVRSVVLVTKNRELKDVRSVALDTSSRTSVSLVRLIFREFLNVEPEWKQAEPDLHAMLGEADAALIIGDPAMTFPREELRVYDMATLWREHTGLGFVFAMWMAREQSVEKVKRIDFAQARDEGLAHVDDIVTQYEERLNLPRAELLDYLQDKICFKMDAEMRAGLELFYELACKHKLVEELKPLAFVDPQL